MRSLTVRSRLVCAISLLAGLASAGCGSSLPPPTQHSVHLHARPGTPLRAVRWGIVHRRGDAIRIGAFVPFCEGASENPHIERIARDRAYGGVVLTMYVRFPRRPIGSCVGYDRGVSRTVALDAGDLAVYDGAVSPPVQRVRGRARRWRLELRTVRWQLVGAPTGRFVRLANNAGACSGRPKPRVASVRVGERKRSVVLTVALAEERPWGHRDLCMGLGFGVAKSVRLPLPLRGRSLYDGGASPPEKRWPRPRGSPGRR